MKKIKLLIIMFLCFSLMNVKADMGPPMIIKHQVMVTNKNGAQCYENGKKTKDIIPYGATFDIDIDVDSDGYISVAYKNIYCDVKSSDISSKTQSFDMNNSDVSKIEITKAVILAKGGLNMRKGPSVTYSKIITVPQYSVVTLTHNAGDNWYYADYNGTKGWITGMNGYFGTEGKEVLVYYKDVTIYSSPDQKTAVGKIPANKEVTDYLNVSLGAYNGRGHYVIYNGVKGYVEHMLYKTDGTGKIKLIKDYDVKTDYGEAVKKLTKNQEIEYTMTNGDGKLYFPEKKIEAYIDKDSFEYVNKALALVKKSGYIGEGLFGEKKEEKPQEATDDPVKVEDPIIEDDKETNKTDIIIICLLAGIFLALTALVIIKLVNSKKETKLIEKSIVKKEIKEEENNENKEV